MPSFAPDFTTLILAKQVLNVSTSSDDALIGNLIAASTPLITSYCARDFAFMANRDETYPPTNRTYLAVRHSPIQKITSITASGVLLTAGTDYLLDAYDQSLGMVYRSPAWYGEYIIGGLVGDIRAGARMIEIVYDSGYYLPADSTNYKAGDPVSLPLDLTFAANQIVARMYFQTKRQAFGLDMIKEGDLMYKYYIQGSETNNATGLTQIEAGLLNKYRRTLVQ